MTEDQVFRERIRNWVRVYSTDTRWAETGGCLAKFTDYWREEKYRDGGHSTAADVADAELLESAWRRLQDKDKRILRDWHILGMSLGKVARRNACFYRDTMRHISAAERRFLMAVRAIEEAIDKREEMRHTVSKI